jgi:hypothetical protein
MVRSVALALAAVRRYPVNTKFWKATVAGVSTLAVTNLPADAFAYEGETVAFRGSQRKPVHCPGAPLLAARR